MIEFGFGFNFGPPGFVPAWKKLAISKGWGYGEIIPGSIQPDNNQLKTGIIGLTNKGQPRKPDDWGGSARLAVGCQPDDRLLRGK